MATKKAVIRNEFKRAHKLASNEEAKSRSYDRIQNLFEMNGYPKQMIRNIRREVQRQQTHHQHQQHHHHHQHRRHPLQKTAHRTRP